MEERVEREDGGWNRDRSCEDGHCSVAVFITENHVKMTTFCFHSGNKCEIPCLA